MILARCKDPDHEEKVMGMIYYHIYKPFFLTLMGITVFSLRKVKYFTVIGLLLIIIL